MVNISLDDLLKLIGKQTVELELERVETARLRAENAELQKRIDQPAAKPTGKRKA